VTTALVILTMALGVAAALGYVPPGAGLAVWGLWWLVGFVSKLKGRKR